MKPESALQIEIVNWLSTRAQKNNFFFFSIPNEGALAGGHSSPAHGAVIAQLKKLGLTPGVPDLCILKADRAYFVEVKCKGGSLSKAQKFVLGRLGDVGVRAGVVRSLEEFIITCEIWGIVE